MTSVEDGEACPDRAGWVMVELATEPTPPGTVEVDRPGANGVPPHTGSEAVSLENSSCA